MSRPEPNFFIVGAPRAGTSSLWRYLSQHPEIFMTVKKEPTYFCHTHPTHGVKTLEEYLALFAEAGGYRVIGEASPDYFASPESAGLIHERYPEAKIIITLRNPVDRAYSLYRLNCSLGVERMPTFERALAREEARLKSDNFKRRNPLFWRSCLYFRAAFMSEHVARYRDLFGAERLHVMLMSDLKQRPVEAMRELYTFLGVDPEFRPDFDVRNRSEYPLAIMPHYVMCRLWRKYANHRRQRGQPDPTWVDHCFTAAYRVNTSLGTKVRKNRVEPQTRRALTALYTKDITRTGELIGRDLSDWLK